MKLSSIAATTFLLILNAGCIEDPKETAAETEDATPGDASGGGGGGVTEPDADSPEGGEVAEFDASSGRDAEPVGEPDAAEVPPDAAPPAPTCDDEDDNVGNGGPGTATPLALGDRFDNLYLCAGTEDWYQVEMAAEQFAVFQLAADPVETDLDLFLTDADGQVLDTSATETGSERIEFVAPGDGIYFIRVVGGFRDVEAAYTLGATSACRLDAECGADQVCSLATGQCEDHEDANCGVDDAEENDRDADAFALDVAGGPFEAVSCAPDPDWFKVVINPGDDLDILVSFPAGEDIDLVVRNLSNGAQVAVANGGAEFNPERLHLAHLAPGDYAIGAFLFNEDGGGRNVNYSIDVAVTAGRCGSDADCTGGNGPICDVELGACIPVPNAGSVEIGGQCGSTEDCAGAEGEVACLQGAPGGADNYCTAGCESDDECELLGEGAYCLRSRGLQVCTRPCEVDAACSMSRECVNGRCERRPECDSDDDCDEGQECLQGQNGAFQCQDERPPVDCGHDVNADGTVREDDDREHTVPLALDGVPVEGQRTCDGDLDWFRIDVPPESAGDTLVASATFSGGVDLDLYLVDVDGNVVGAAESGEGGAEELRFPYVPPGPSYIVPLQVRTDALADSVYSLAALIESTETGCTAEGDECASTFPLRMVCEPMSGACSNLNGMGMVALGGLCDTDDDCGEGAEICWNREGVEASMLGYNICTHTCDGDGACEDVPGTECLDFQQFALCLPPR